MFFSFFFKNITCAPQSVENHSHIISGTPLKTKIKRESIAAVMWICDKFSDKWQKYLNI